MNEIKSSKSAAAVASQSIHSSHVAHYFHEMTTQKKYSNDSTTIDDILQKRDRNKMYKKNQTFADVKHRKDVCEVSENDEVKETRQQSLVSSST